jgi:hypothetical protein
MSDAARRPLADLVIEVRLAGDAARAGSKPRDGVLAARGTVSGSRRRHGWWNDFLLGARRGPPACGRDREQTGLALAIARPGA